MPDTGTQFVVLRDAATGRVFRFTQSAAARCSGVCIWCGIYILVRTNDVQAGGRCARASAGQRSLRLQALQAQENTSVDAYVMLIKQFKGTRHLCRLMRHGTWIG